MLVEMDLQKVVILEEVGNLADSVVNSALRYRAHQPFLDSLLKEIGMNPGEISNIRNILGDYDNPKKDFHMNFDKDPTSKNKT